MAYMSQERKKEIAKNVKTVAKKYGFGGRDVTVGVRNHSSLVVNIFRGPLDFIGDAQAHNDELARMRGTTSYPVGTYIQVNPYYCEEWAIDPTIKQFYTELMAAIKSTGYYNNSDAQIDYFDHDFYIDINVGRWDREYVCTANELEAA